jgi:hypothetical protein
LAIFGIQKYFDLSLPRPTDDRLVLLVGFGHLSQKEVDDVGGLAGSGRPDEEHGLLVRDEQLHDGGVAHRVDRLHQDLVEGDVLRDRSLLQKQNFRATSLCAQAYAVQKGGRRPQAARYAGGPPLKRPFGMWHVARP